MKHTPGPWRKISNTVVSFAPEGLFLIADVGHEIPEQERAANARLIASAPDMLLLLKEASIELGAFVSSGAGGPTKRIFEMIQGMISKVDGA